MSSSSPPSRDSTIVLPLTAPFPDLHPESPLPILIRATNAKSKDNKRDKIKLSTIVQSDELDGFFMKYAEVCKTGMSGLKKRDRSGRKAKVKEKKKKKGSKLSDGQSVERKG